ncbi:hypothetical protein DW219_07255 [Desulfovibrio sp. AM18-2]|nr:hypothetical protein DW219_07255 [Desulfovibrio sp. AM18-2]
MSVARTRAFRASKLRKNRTGSRLMRSANSSVRALSQGEQASDLIQRVRVAFTLGETSSQSAPWTFWRP